MISAPYPKAPTEIKVSANTPTFSELTMITGRWLADAELLKIDALRLIGEMVAEPGERYPYSLRRPYNRYKTGSITVHYKTIRFVEYNNICVHGDFYRIVVTEGGRAGHELLDGFQLVNYFGGQSEDGRTADQLGQTNDNLYIPGDWEAIIPPAYEQAKAIQLEQENAAEMKQRNQLLERIGLKGKNHDRK